MKKLCTLLLALTSTLANAQKSTPPNIIFILADDMGYGDAGCYGQQYIKTPHIDRLAEEGLRFTDFYAGSTVCSPSRAALMTGQHTGKTHIRGNGPVWLRPEDRIIPEYLKQQGYTTAMVGKWGLGLAHTDGVPHKKSWDYFVGHLENVEAHFQHGDSLWYTQNGATTKIKLEKERFYNEVFTDSALAFLQKKRQQPFFLFVSYTLPHAELRVQDSYMKQYLNAAGQSIFLPEQAQKEGQHYRSQPFPKAGYAAMISSMDDYIGKIMAELKQLGLEKNTLVVFTSDNGTHTEGGRRPDDVYSFFKSSGPFTGHKRDLYEGGIRVPFIVKWPEIIKPGTETDFQGAFWDVLPTFNELAGGKPIAGTGISLRPTLQGKHQNPHSALYWEFYEGGFKQAVRFGNWKAIRYYNKTRPERTELFDLGTDPGEKSNLSLQFPNKVKELEQLMEREHTTPSSPVFLLKE